jgi:hypothetical protein
VSPDLAWPIALVLVVAAIAWAICYHRYLDHVEIMNGRREVRYVPDIEEEDDPEESTDE